MPPLPSDALPAPTDPGPLLPAAPGGRAPAPPATTSPAGGVLWYHRDPIPNIGVLVLRPATRDRVASELRGGATAWDVARALRLPFALVVEVAAADRIFVAPSGMHPRVTDRPKRAAARLRTLP